MADSYTPITNVLDFQKSFKPAGAFPLDARSMFATKTAADAAAASAVLAGTSEQSNSSYYVGQLLTVFENGVVTHYSIQADKTLKEVGKSIATDDKTIVMNNEVLSLKDFGVQYYAYVEATEDGEEDSYVLTQGWKAGLQPRVIANTDGTGYSLAWYEPSSTTVEGLNDIVTSMQTTVDGLDERIASAEATNNANSEAIETLEAAQEATAAKADANAEAIETLNANAETEGSVKYQIAQAISLLVENPDEAMNSINELVTWAETHASDALELSNDVAANTKAIEDLEALLGTKLPEGTQATDIVGYIQEAVADETTRATAAEAALQAKIEALEAANEKLGTAAYEAKEAFATAAQGALAESAVQSVVAGDNGHIMVDNEDVKVYEAPVASTNVLGDVKVDGSSIGATEEGVISVIAVDKSKITGLTDAISAAQEAAVEEAANSAADLYVAKTDIVETVNSENASGSKIASEKAVVDAMSWIEGM